MMLIPPFLASLLAASVAAQTGRELLLLSCLNTTGIETLALTDATYSSASTPYNLRYHYYPAAIVYPKSAQDVSAAVQCAASTNISVSARSGGHSYTAYGLGGADGSLVVDMSAFDTISFAADGVTATIGTGNRLGDVALGLYAAGKRALPHGVCPQVGVGGHVAFGGFGLTSRQWGLALDRMVGAEVVLANGTLVNASNSAHSDLFWAIRGSAPSFGIATSYTFSTLPAPNVTTTFTYNFTNHNTSYSAASALLAFQSFGEEADGNLGLQLIMTADLPWYITGSYPGNATQLHKALKPLLDELPQPSGSNVTELGWIDYLTAIAGNNGGLNATSYPDSHDTFYAKSPIVPASAPLTSHEAHTFFDWIFSTASDLSWFIEVNLYGGKYSAISAVPSNATAYGNRDGLMTFQLYASSSNITTYYPDAGFEFLDGMVQALASPNRTDFGYYPNYPDDRLTPAQWQSGYYGPNYPRLVQLKAVVDPNGVFTYPQAIGK